MSDIQSLIIASAIAIPIILILKPMFVRSKIPHASGEKFFTGHTDKILADPINAMKQLREKYGSLYSINYLGKKVFIFGKEWMDELFKNKELEFNEALNETFLVFEAIGISRAMHDPKLSIPKMVRSLITPYLKSYSTRIYDQINLVEKEILKDKDSSLVTVPSDIMRRMVVKASSNIMLGSRLSEDEEVIDAFYNFPINVEHSVFSKLKYAKYPIVGRLYAKFLLRKEKVHLPYHKLFFGKISEEVATRKSEENVKGYQKPNDLLQRFLDEGFNIEDITLLVASLVFASVVTTTNNSTLALYDLVTYPEYYNELYEEQLQIKKEFGDDISPDIVSKMLKLNSFIREAMRFRLEAINNFRIVKSDWILSNGIVIPKGSFIAVDSTSLHFDNELQDGNAYEFKPFRHYEKGKLATKTEPQNLSFGFGTHACPGRFLAIQEISTILSVLIRSYKISTQDGKPHPYMVKPAQFDLPKGEPLIFSKIYD
jgi:cytochrome P450